MPVPMLMLITLLDAAPLSPLDTIRSYEAEFPYLYTLRLEYQQEKWKPQETCRLQGVS